MSVEAMLFAVDHVRVRVAIVNPGAYRSCTIRPLCTTIRLVVICSADARVNAQSDAACSPFASTFAGSGVSATRSPSGQGIVAASPGGAGRSSDGRLAMSASV